MNGPFPGATSSFSPLLSATYLGLATWRSKCGLLLAAALAAANFNSMRLAKLFALLSLLPWLAPLANADATILLEEPYSYDGALAGTGHAAVYLNRVCAASPTVLRRCGLGERGVVISRYTRIGGYDWIAIPLIPYLYAVDNPEDVPLYANSKLAAFLRD